MSDELTIGDYNDLAPYCGVGSTFGMKLANAIALEKEQMNELVFTKEQRAELTTRSYYIPYWAIILADTVLVHIVHGSDREDGDEKESAEFLVKSFRFFKENTEYVEMLVSTAALLGCSLAREGEWVSLCTTVQYRRNPNKLKSLKNAIENIMEEYAKE